MQQIILPLPADLRDTAANLHFGQLDQLKILMKIEKSRVKLAYKLEKQKLEQQRKRNFCALELSEIREDSILAYSGRYPKENAELLSLREAFKALQQELTVIKKQICMIQQLHCSEEETKEERKEEENEVEGEDESKKEAKRRKTEEVEKTTAEDEDEERTREKRKGEAPLIVLPVFSTPEPKAGTQKRPFNCQSAKKMLQNRGKPPPLRPNKKVVYPQASPDSRRVSLSPYTTSRNKAAVGQDRRATMGSTFWK
jgi:hypothetical protein